MTPKTDPISVGIHPIFGLFVGGSDINDEYDLKIKSPYKQTNQLYTPKQSSSSERALMNARFDPSKFKFHGKLETPADCAVGNDKEEFLQAVKEQFSHYSLQELFSVTTYDVNMKNIVLNSCLFELDTIIK